MEAWTLPLAVIMERLVIKNRWCSEKWCVHGVVLDSSERPAPERVLFEDAQQCLVLFPGRRLALYRDEAEGYYLNLSSPQPKVFVAWRREETLAQPAMITVSYHEAARWLDAGEQVDGVAMPPEIYRWVGEFVEAYYRPQPAKQERRRREANNDPERVSKGMDH